MAETLFSKRKVRVAYHNTMPQAIDAQVMLVERTLSFLGDTHFVKMAALADLANATYDVLIINAPHLDEAEFRTWLGNLKSRLAKPNHIWIPCVIIRDLSNAALQEMWHEAVQQNWYFDIISSTHIGSLPLRVANLLRINDHLHELFRYDAELKKLRQQVEELEKKLTIPKH